MTMLTTEQLNAIKERAEKATAGPWEIIEEIDGVYSGKRTVVRTTKPSSHWRSRIVSVGQTRWHDGENAEKNVEFIAHSRTDIPALIAEVEKLRDEISLLCPIGDYDVITSLKSEKKYQAEIIAKLQSKIATYESLAQEFNYGAILDEMVCEGVNHDD